MIGTIEYITLLINQTENGSATAEQISNHVDLSLAKTQEVLTDMVKGGLLTVTLIGKKYSVVK